MAAQPSKLRSFAIILVGAFSIYLVTNFFTKNDKVVEKTQISVRSSPEIESIPGSIKNNDRYIKLQQENNAQRASDAKKRGESALPTMVNKPKEDKTDEEFFKDFAKKQAPQDEKKNREDALKKAQEDADKRLKEQQNRLDKLRKEQDEKRRLTEQSRLDQQRNQNYQKDLDVMKGIVLNEINLLTKGYSSSIKQVYVGSKTTPDDLNQNNKTSQMDKASQPSAPASAPIKATPFYKAGTVIYGVIQTDYNSDNAGPILARITSGPLAGSTLIGTASQPSSEWSSGMGVVFNTLVTPFGTRSQSVALTAINPENYQTGVSSSTNYHYAQRYGAMILSGAIQQASSQAQSGSGSSSENSNTTGSSTTSTKTSTNTTSGYASIFSPISSQISANLSKVGSRAPTYTIHQGTAIGLLFLNDFVLES